MGRWGVLPSMTTMVRFLLFVILLHAAPLCAQQWQWAVNPVRGYEVVDVSVGPQKQSVVITQVPERSYTLTLIDSTGQTQASQEYYFGQWYGDRVLFSQIDAQGNVWVLSRQMLDIHAQRANDAYPYDAYGEEMNQEPLQEPEYQQFIILEKYTSDLELTQSYRLIKCFGNEYRLDVDDMEMDAEGNIWLCAEVSDTFQFQERTYVPGYNGGAFLLCFPGERTGNFPWLNFFVKNNDCCQGSVQSFHLAVNKSGTCVVSGSFTKELTFENGTRFTNGPDGIIMGEMFLAAFSSTGKMMWTKRIGTQSDDKDVIALSDGSFVCSGTFREATTIDKFTVPGGKNYGNFIMRVDEKNGAFRQFYCQDTSSMLHLFPGSNADFYAMFCKGNSSQDYLIYHFDQKLKPEFRTQIYGIDPCVGVCNGTLVVGGMWNWLCAIGPRPYVFFLGGHQGDEGSVVARWDFEKR